MVAVDIPRNGRLLMEAFWPGPSDLIAAEEPAGTVHRDCGAVPGRSKDAASSRCPQTDRARGSARGGAQRKLVRRTSPTRADFVLQDLDGRIDAVIDSGDTTLGLESTVVDVCEEPPILYRPGMVTLQQLQSLCPGLVTYRERGWSHRTAGFARPRTEALLPARAAHSAGVGPARVELLSLAAKLQAAGERVGLMLPTAFAAELDLLDLCVGRPGGSGKACPAAVCGTAGVGCSRGNRHCLPTAGRSGARRGHSRPAA